ncbi:hypothetical protein SPI_03968 [Niveomyces insectorum RCEF 264]|uniref:Uncharacterized protein n=1 Tax=Niveomyces insectorum RCEF 264 TaxID=1081102 RepID=A0A167VBA6_9HYPO|nr:hypothetical protein SPI_03968 [Niveomyces insectorum RCEF 264]
MPAAPSSRRLWAASAVVLLAILNAGAVVVQASPSAFAGNDAAAAALLHRAPHPDLAAAALLPRAAAATNLQLFRGALANVAAPAIAQSNDATRPFAVDGDTFTDFRSAADRSCDNQHNSCADAANSNKQAGFTVGDCDTQNTQCKAAAVAATQTAFTTLASSSAEFDIFCDL